MSEYKDVFEGGSAVDVSFEELMALPSEELHRRAQAIIRELDSPEWSERKIMSGLKPGTVLGLGYDE